jgi:hypothetical protein
MKANKYSYLYVLQGFYGMGWEDLSAEEQTPAGRKLIRETRNDYLRNEGGNYRIIKRRELNSQI